MLGRRIVLKERCAVRNDKKMIFLNNLCIPTKYNKTCHFQNNKNDTYKCLKSK
jgi:hypothetical protein